MQKLGIDARLVVFFLLQALLSSLGFSVWALVSNQPFDDALIRAITGTIAIFSLAILLSPLWLPLALVGWAVAWFFVRSAGVLEPTRAAVAGAVAGLGAALTMAWAPLGSYAADNLARYLVGPLFCITPIAGAICGLFVSRRR